MEMISFIQKSKRLDPDHRIEYIGGVGPTLIGAWKVSVDDAIRDIKCNPDSYWVGEGSRRVRVIVATSARGNEFLKTEDDGIWENNLLSLPQMPDHAEIVVKNAGSFPMRKTLIA